MHEILTIRSDHTAFSPSTAFSAFSVFSVFFKLFQLFHFFMFFILGKNKYFQDQLSTIGSLFYVFVPLIIIQKISSIWISQIFNQSKGCRSDFLKANVLMFSSCWCMTLTPSFSESALRSGSRTRRRAGRAGGWEVVWAVWEVLTFTSVAPVQPPLGPSKALPQRRDRREHVRVLCIGRRNPPPFVAVYQPPPTNR